ncbi:MAG: TonB-dependent receptor [Bacteroidia bacterium]
MILNPGNHVQFTDSLGQYRFEQLQPGDYQVEIATLEGEVRHKDSLKLGSTDLVRDLRIQQAHSYNSGVDIIEGPPPKWLRQVEGVSVFAARKCELIRPGDLPANLSTNNARQVFNRVAGLNVWENDGGGLQLGIGGRGLSPNRSSNFNTRQNGYDIAADALGYPESYYTPPMEAIARIEVVRGAASLQYGTQFGGLVNFVFKEGPENKKIAFTSRQTGGTYGYLGSFNSVGGTIAKGNLNYYAFYQFKRGNGWQENSGFQQHTAYAGVKARLAKRLVIGGEYTYMHYLAQQAGGLTDAMFDRDPRQSIRDRNWFRVNWNLAAVTADLELGAHTKVNLRTFGLYAQRDALGFLGAINRVDPGGDRDLITGSFQNWGSELRLLKNIDIRSLPTSLLVGGRYYQGHTTAAQGLGSAGNGPDFGLLNPEKPEGSNYVFPSRNVAAFAEYVIRPHANWTIVPGLRYEYIHTASEGSYQLRSTDLAGNVIYEATIADQQQRDRNILLAGIGGAFKPNTGLEAFANISRNYRAITFTDMRVVNPNFQIDPDLRDEKGFNADIGLRGSPRRWFSYDVSAFWLQYRDRIGQVLMVDSTTFRYYRLRTNVSDSRNLGLECYAEMEFLHFIPKAYYSTLKAFVNVAWIDARYIGSKQSAYNGKKVELVPTWNIKTGLTYQRRRMRAGMQWSWLSKQFSDATNAETSPNAVEGLIPAYQVLDLSLSYEFKTWLSLEANCNNVLNTMYFTRRAASYPGPGIIPADGRSLFLTLQVKL